MIGNGRYQIVAKPGEGSMGTVYRARDQHLGTDVVVKMARPMLLADADAVKRFLREVRSLVQLAHPHIVRILDVGQHQGAPYAVMQYLAGGSLEERRPRASDGRPVN